MTYPVLQDQVEGDGLAADAVGTLIIPAPPALDSTPPAPAAPDSTPAPPPPGR